MTLLEKLRQTSMRWRIYILIGVVVYFIAVNQVLHVRPDHIFLALFMLSLALGKSKVRRFVADWLPFVLFWILYDMMRGVAESWRGVIHVKDVYETELFLFGKLFGGRVLPFVFQQFQMAFQGRWFKEVLDLLAANFYTFHFATPLIAGWILWHTTNDRKMYYRFVYTLTILNVMALITFFLFPSAPPWYVWKHGFVQPLGKAVGAAGSLIYVDQILKVNFFTTLWDNFNANHYAAIPSLHGAYPIVVILFIYIKFKKHLKWLILYPVATWLSAAYLNHHYLVDLIIGGIYVVIAYYLNHKLLMPYVFEKTLFRSGNTVTFPDKIKPEKEHG